MAVQDTTNIGISDEQKKKFRWAEKEVWTVKPGVDSCSGARWTRMAASVNFHGSHAIHAGGWRVAFFFSAPSYFVVAALQN
jgi:hypothetical protein